MTTISNQSLRNFNKCRKWKDVWDYHKKFTPWLDDTQIKEFLNLYKA